MKDLTLFIVSAAFLLFMGYQFIQFVKPVTFGAASPGTAATVATSTAVAMAANTVQTIVASSTSGTSNCLARVIGTTAAAVTLTFNDIYSPGGQSGFVQPASTTVAYDASVYGCGKVKAYSFAAQTLNVQETR